MGLESLQTVQGSFTSSRSGHSSGSLFHDQGILGLSATVYESKDCCRKRPLLATIVVASYCVVTDWIAKLVEPPAFSMILDHGCIDYIAKLWVYEWEKSGEDW